MSEPINPYAVTSLSDPQKVAVQEPVVQPQRSYGLRMDWEDRRRFLEVVGPFRLFAGINAISAFFGMLGAAGSIARAFFESGNLPIVLRELVALTAYLVVLYLQWLNWRFAATIAATAGGTTSSMSEWSRLQLRVIWLNLIYLLLYYSEWTLEWGRFFFARLSNL